MRLSSRPRSSAGRFRLLGCTELKSRSVPCTMLLRLREVQYVRIVGLTKSRGGGATHGESGESEASVQLVSSLP